MTPQRRTASSDRRREGVPSVSLRPRLLELRPDPIGVPLSRNFDPLPLPKARYVFGDLVAI